MPHIRNKSVMVLGLSGTGKSTLINYLNNIPLVCLEKKGKWILDLESQNLTLPGGFSIAKIGHEVYSQTFLPASYNSQLEEFSYIDNPGFKDTHGLSVEIANSFFREHITSNVKDFKFLLLLSHPDLTDRGNQFRESIKHISHFIGAFDDDDTKGIGKSIGIVVTKVDNHGESDEDVKNDLQIKLKDILQDEIDNEKLSPNEEIVFGEIIENFQIEIFSNPMKNGPVNTNQSKSIINLIKEKLQYAKKSELKIRAKIEDTSKVKLLKYIQYKNRKFEEDFDQILSMAFYRYFEQSKRKTVQLSNRENQSVISDLKKTANIYIVVNELVKNNSKEGDFDNFMKNLNNKILNEEEKEELSNKMNTINFFLQLFSNEEIKGFKRVYWINEKNKSKLENFIKNLKEYLSEEFKNFKHTVEDTIMNSIYRYAETVINHNGIQQLKNHINEIKNSIRDNNFELLKLTILSEKEREFILSKEKMFEPFISLLPSDEKNEYSINNKKWVGVDFIERFQEIQEDLKRYDEEKTTYKNGIFIYKGFFANISYILHKMNEYDIYDLKSVQIYAINSINFDTDYFIEKEKYIDNAPDLIIVSPRVLKSKQIYVDLSSSHIPGYPDGKEKANNGIGDGSNGNDGKPGLPGYNGGNMLIVSNEANLYDLEFTSKGGKGGPGQNGLCVINNIESRVKINVNNLKRDLFTIAYLDKVL